MGSKNRKSATVESTPESTTETPVESVANVNLGKPRGGGNLAQQISRLEAKVGPEGIEAAAHILATYSPDVIGLAFKRIDSVPTLGKRDLARLEKISDPVQREKMKAFLLGQLA